MFMYNGDVRIFCTPPLYMNISQTLRRFDAKPLDRDAHKRYNSVNRNNMNCVLLWLQLRVSASGRDAMMLSGERISSYTCFREEGMCISNATVMVGIEEPLNYAAR
jgi:hypothetical protein